jgi:1-acyl-sn-glycerol-3-phosphate acyltransferase
MRGQSRTWISKRRREERDVRIPYPRRYLQRAVLRGLARVLFGLLSKLEITGLDNFPESGPLLVVGNHVAAFEAALMVVYAPLQVELLAAGDIPLDPNLSPFANAYGYIPIKRGTMDRQALSKALDVLKQDGVIGIFPEGGIWEPGPKRPQSGVAWLSYYAQAPVVPIGFGGMEGAISKLIKFKRPALQMHVGEPLPPVRRVKGQSRKACFEQAATRIMDAVYALIPEEDKRYQSDVLNERFALHVAVYDGTSAQPEGVGPAAQRRRVVDYPDALAITQEAALSKFFHRPVLLDIFGRNLKLPVRALQDLASEPPSPPPSAQVVVALDPILVYLEEENPYLFTYRFGYDWGTAMKEALVQLRALAGWAAERDYELEVVPIRRYYSVSRGEEVVEIQPGALPKM